MIYVQTWYNMAEAVSLVVPSLGRALIFVALREVMKTRCGA